MEKERESKMPKSIPEAYTMEKAAIEKTISWLNKYLKDSKGDPVDISGRQMGQSLIYKFYRLQMQQGRKASNKEIAALVGVSEVSIREWRDGHQTPTPENLVKLFEAYESLKKRLN